MIKEFGDYSPGCQEYIFPGWIVSSKNEDKYKSKGKKKKEKKKDSPSSTSIQMPTMVEDTGTEMS